MKTDFEIKKEVQEQLASEPTINAKDINISVASGVVVLSGKVDAYYKKDIAAKAARKVIGVSGIFENLKVNLSFENKKTDMEIEQAVLNELKKNSSIGNKVKIEVKKGIVTVDGAVEWEFQKIEIRHAIKKLAGIRDIINNIKIVPMLTAQKITQKINHALHSNGIVDAGKINIETTGNKVTLTGQVRSWMEKKEAEYTAWFTPGVAKVESKLEVV